MGAKFRGPRVVDQRIDSSPFLLRRIRERSTSVIFGNIGLHYYGFNAEFFANPLSRYRAIFVVGIIDDDVTAFFRKLTRTGCAYAR